MSNNIDYSTVDVPKSESPEKYHYTVRRAEILKFILRAGSPAHVWERFEGLTSTITMLTVSTSTSFTGRRKTPR